jgi:predicted DNA-binding transcriptional regulator AlpA
MSEVTPAPSTPLVFNDHKASEFLGMSVHTLRRMRVQGTGPAYRKMGKTVRYALSDIQAYIEKSAVTR